MVKKIQFLYFSLMMNASVVFANEGSHGDLLHTWVYPIINLVLFAIILHLLLKKKLVKAVEDRQVNAKELHDRLKTEHDKADEQFSAMTKEMNNISEKLAEIKKMSANHEFNLQKKNEELLKNLSADIEARTQQLIQREVASAKQGLYKEMLNSVFSDIQATLSDNTNSQSQKIKANNITSALTHFDIPKDHQDGII